MSKRTLDAVDLGVTIAEYACTCGNPPDGQHSTLCTYGRPTVSDVLDHTDGEIEGVTSDYERRLTEWAAEEGQLMRQLAVAAVKAYEQFAPGEVSDRFLRAAKVEEQLCKDVLAHRATKPEPPE